MAPRAPSAPAPLPTLAIAIAASWVAAFALPGLYRDWRRSALTFRPQKVDNEAEFIKQPNSTQNRRVERGKEGEGRVVSRTGAAETKRLRRIHAEQRC